MLAVAVAVAALLATGCRGASCAELSARADHASAAKVCARAFEERGDLAAGVAAAEAALKLRQDDRVLALADRLLATPRGADARRLIARVHLGRERFELARPLLEQALREHQVAGDHAGAYADAAALVTGYWNRSDFASALPLAQLARDEAAAAGAPKLHATALIALGSVYQAIGDGTRAQQVYAQATDELPAEDHLGRARLLLYRATLWIDEHQLALAAPLLEEARALATERWEPTLVLAAEVNLADIALRRHALDAAEGHLVAAEAAWRASGDAQPSAGILINQSILARSRGDFAGAARALDAVAGADPPPETALILAQERGELAAAQGQWSAAEAHYLAAIERAEELWRTASPEELKAPFFEDRWQPYLNLLALRAEHGRPAEVFATLVATQGRMFLSELLAAAARGDGGLARLRRLRALSSAVAASPLAREVDAEATRAALRGHYVLNYFSAGGRLRLLVLEDGEPRLASVNLELGQVEALVDGLLTKLDDPGAAAALGAALLPPDALARASRRIHVVPSGPLMQVPFAALLVSGARLVAQHDVAYAPSAAGLAALVRLADGAPREAEGVSAVVLGDARGDLPHSAEEVRDVVLATGARAYLGAEADLGALRGASRAPLLHVAAHARVGVDGGALELADGKVDAAEILQLGVHPRLVVLAACASAASDRRDMWGSLAVAFLAAGSHHVVATLFSVEDRVAATFSRRFYRHRPLLDPVAAVAAAQRELMIDQPVSAWAGFMVIGW